MNEYLYGAHKCAELVAASTTEEHGDLALAIRCVRLSLAQARLVCKWIMDSFIPSSLKEQEHRLIARVLATKHFPK